MLNRAPSTKTLGALLALATFACAEADPREAAPGSSGSAEATAAATSPLSAGLSASVTVTSEWQTGLCGAVRVLNGSSAAVSDWTATLALGSSTLSNSWNGTATGSTGTVTITPASWNARIEPGRSAEVGFCLNKGPGYTPPTVSLPGGGEQGCSEPQATRVELRVSHVDDLVRVRVNGVPRRAWQFRGVDQGRRIDITDWFDNGPNIVEFEAENFGGPGDYGVELWVNDTLVVNERCPESVCVPGGNAPAGTLLRKAYTFTAEGLEQSLPAKVELRVSDVDDFAYATVNGVRRGEWRLGMPAERIDVTSWFMNGRNDVRLQALNGSGPAGARFELWVDGRLVVNDGCSEGVCPPGADARSGLIFDKSYSIDVSGVRSGRELDLTSAVPGKLYVDNVYTGLTTPTRLTLPPGRYTLGLGISNDTPGASTGRFHEELVRVGRCAKQVDLSLAPEVAANPWRILVLPVRYTEHGGPADLGVLADTDVTLMTGQTIATSSAWVEPFTYGLQTWDVTTHAVVEDAVLHREAAAGAAPDTGRLLRDAGLEHLESEFDSIVFIYSVHRRDGASVENTPCCGWASGSHVSLNTGWVRGRPATSPNEGLLHEVLHTQESYQSWMQYGLWNGLDGLHGAEEHGYRAEDEAGGEGWRRWYRTFMRGQAAETRDMLSGVDFPSVPTQADLWTGIFYTTRYGRDGVVGGYPVDP